MNTTKKLAEELGCTPQAINKAIRKACDDEGIDPKAFGQLDPRDKRIRTFSSDEVRLILKYAPAPKPVSEPDSETVSETLTPFVETTAIAPAIPDGLVLRTARPMIGFNVQNLNVNLMVSSTEALDKETQSFNSLAATAFNALKQITKDELQADINQMKAQNKHAIAGVQAAAAVEVVQDLVNQQRQQAQPQSDCAQSPESVANK